MFEIRLCGSHRKHDEIIDNYYGITIRTRVSMDINHKHFWHSIVCEPFHAYTHIHVETSKNMYTYTHTHSHVHITNTYRYAHTNAEKNIHAIAHTYLCTFITGYEKK